MYLCIYIATHLHKIYLDWLQAVLGSNSRCPWKWRSSELRDTLRGRDRVSLEMHFGGRDRASLEIHLEATIERVWRCNWRAWSSDFGDELGGRNRASLEIHLEAVFERVWRCTLEAVIERVWRCTWRPWSCDFANALWRPWLSDFSDALGGHDRASLETHLDAVIERLWR